MSELNEVILCLGSNRNKKENIERAVELLSAHFIHIVFSDVTESEPMGSHTGAETYLNQVVRARTEETLEQVSLFVKQVEREMGRVPEDKARKSIPIDIDILQWNHEVLREEEMLRPYVQAGMKSLDDNILNS